MQSAVPLFQEIQIAKQIIEDKKSYKKELDRFWEIYATGQYQNLLSKVITINKKIESAVSTSINMYRKLDGTLFGEENENYPLLHISAFPTEGKSYLLVSSLKENEKYFNKFIQQFMLMSEQAILKRFNIIIPLLAENIMMSPRIVNKMTEQEKRELLTIFRIETLGFYYKMGININSWAEQVTYSIW